MDMTMNADTNQNQRQRQNRQSTTSTGTEAIEWRYAAGFTGGYESRHEAVGEAAIAARRRYGADRSVTVWAYPVCACEPAVKTLSPDNYCGRCGAMIADD